MNHDVFWERVNAALDARADPLEDPQVARALELEPERLETLLRLESALVTLPAPQPRRRAGGVVAIAAVAAAGLALLLFAAQREKPGPELAPVSHSNAAAPFELGPCLGVLELRVTHTLVSHDAQHTLDVDVLASRTRREILRNEPTGHSTSFSFATLHPLSDSP